MFNNVTANSGKETVLLIEHELYLSWCDRTLRSLVGCLKKFIGMALNPCCSWLKTYIVLNTNIKQNCVTMDITDIIYVNVQIKKKSAYVIILLGIQEITIKLHSKISNIGVNIANISLSFCW